jgi:hypothetical protein
VGTFHEAIIPRVTERAYMIEGHIMSSIVVRVGLLMLNRTYLPIFETPPPDSIDGMTKSLVFHVK